jgi:arylsulfatase
MESFEGGLHTPMIIHWPNGLKRKKGTTSNALGHVSDIFPTIMHINNLKYSKTYQQNKLTSLDGESFLPIIKNKSEIGRDGIFFEHAKGKAYIKDGWKLVMKTNGSEWELYQLSKDKNEITNLAALKPETVKIMRMAWEKWYAEMRTFYN